MILRPLIAWGYLVAQGAPGSRGAWSHEAPGCLGPPVAPSRLGAPGRLGPLVAWDPLVAWGPLIA